MEEGQLLSPILRVVKDRWQAEGKLPGTHASALPDGAISFEGARQPWPALMQSLLQPPSPESSHRPAALPVHPAVEPFETESVGVGARVSPRHNLEAGTFLGCYGGWLGTLAEGLLLPRDETGASLGASPTCGSGWSERAAELLLERASRTMKVRATCIT